jgi:diguanylate cyclase (GGDEF)-like protein
MKTTQLRHKLLLGALAISLVVALASMLAVSLVIRQQHLDQSNGLLRKAFRVIDETLADRKEHLLAASRQLATQKNLGATIWYLGQYAQSGVDRETLISTYQQLAKDIHKIARAGKLSRIAVYDSASNLVSFSVSGGGGETVGFVERSPKPSFQLALLKDGEELDRQTLRTSESFSALGLKFTGRLPQQESVHYAVVDGFLSLESHVPIMGVAFDRATGQQEIKQLGLVSTLQRLDQPFVDHLSRLTEIQINVFTTQGFSSGSLAAYRQPDLSGLPAASDTQEARISFNEVMVEGAGFYQCLIPLYTDKHLMGTIARLHSKEVVQKNTWEMVKILGLIAFACLLFTLPFGWYLAGSIAHPLTVLSRIFRGVASGKQSDAMADERSLLDKQKKRHDELGDLTLSFMAMDDAVNQKIAQINEINASLEHKIEQRTAELLAANEALTQLATHDVLTGLPNRKLFGDRLQQALAAARRNSAHLAVAYIDLDEFKPVNDKYGHAVGDQLLKETAMRIKDCMREADTVARIGGDEFLVLLPLIESEQDARAVAEKIRFTLNKPFDITGASLSISSSIGIAIYPEHGGDENALLMNADAAMYFAKESGRNGVSVFQATA